MGAAEQLRQVARGRLRSLPRFLVVVLLDGHLLEVLVPDLDHVAQLEGNRRRGPLVRLGAQVDSVQRQVPSQGRPEAPAEVQAVLSDLELPFPLCLSATHGS